MKLLSCDFVSSQGNILESTQGPTSKRSDFMTLQSTFETVIQSHYHAAANHIAFRLVHCPQMCSDTLSILSRCVLVSDSRWFPAAGHLRNLIFSQFKLLAIQGT